MSRRRRPPVHRIEPSYLQTSSQLSIRTNETMTPERADDVPTGALYLIDSTSASEIIDEEGMQRLADSPSALVDKYLLSGKYNVPILKISFLILLLASAGIFIQDNGNGTLKVGNWDLIFWTIAKIIVLAFLFFLFLLLYYGIDLLSKSPRVSKKNR